MGLECKWRHARKQWADNLGILKNSQLGVDFEPCKTVRHFVSAIWGIENWVLWHGVESWELTSGHVRQTFSLCHLRHRELNSLPWSRERGVDFGPCKTDDFVSAFGHRELSSLPWSKELESWLGPCRQTVEVEFRPWCWEVGVSTVEAYS